MNPHLKLYMVHCGFYDPAVSDGLYESHTNFFITAASFEDARTKSKLIPEFKNKKMHVDGLQEIQVVEGYKIILEEDLSLNQQNHILNYKHRELAPTPKNNTEN